MNFGEYIPSSIKQFANIGEAVNGYNMLLFITILFFILCIVLAIFNPEGFNKTLGYGIFITLIIVFIVVFILKQTIKTENAIQYASSFQYISDNINAMFLAFGKKETIAVGVLLLALFLGLLGSLGLFTNDIPENNAPALFSYFILLFVAIVSVFLYKKARGLDNIDNLINKTQLSKVVYEDKLKYTLIFIVFIVILLGLYLLNPYGIISDYAGIGTLFFIIFVGMSLFAMIKLNDYFFNNPLKINEYNNSPGFTGFFKTIYVLFSLFISGLLLWGFLYVIGIVNNSGSAYGIGHTIVNLILLMSMLGILYKLANSGGFLEKNPYFRIVLNTLLYIPCILVGVTDYLSKIFFGIKDFSGLETKYGASKNDFAFLILAVFACVSYIFFNSMAGPFVKNQYYKVGGDSLITIPIPINRKTNLSSFRILNGTTGLNYTYSLSFWFYIDSFSPSTSSGYNKSVSIVSYGDQMHVKYYSPTNTLYVTVKEDPENVSDTNVEHIQDLEKTLTVDNSNMWTNIKQQINDSIDQLKGYKGQYELDESNDRIVYKNTNVLLQKWNNIVLNYNGGTLDVFYNGELVKSAVNVINHNTIGETINDQLSVGSDNGISGSVANMTYFKNPIDLLTIDKLYELFKDKNPPLP